MLAIAVEFLHGTYRADPDGGAVTGRTEYGEWPPSVSRLLAAFVAADGMGADCRVTNGVELEFLEGLDPPMIHAEEAPHHQKLNDRYVVKASGDSADKRHTHQEYPAKKGDLVRPGARVAMKDPRVVYVWHDVDPAAWLGPLRLRAARIGYLGCADSPVRVRVGESLNGQELDLLHAYRPHANGTCMVSVPRPGHHLSALATAYESWLEHGPSVSRSQFPALRNVVAYAGPDDIADHDESGSVVAWLQLRPGVPGRRVADVTAALKAAIMSRYRRLHGDPLPRELHGHGFDGKGFEIARYLALPNVGFRRSDGRIHGAAVWLPRGCDTTTVERIRTAARSLDVLRTPSLDVQVTPWHGSGPTSARPGRWRQRSTRWVTAVPAIHERFGRLDLAELGRWCRHAGLPEPVEFRRARVPLVRGALDLHPAEVQRALQKAPDTAKPYSHLELRFAEPVRGPVVIGGGRSRGFGLCIPIDDGPTSAAEASQTRAS